jgi:hypothetical protein
MQRALRTGLAERHEAAASAEQGVRVLRYVAEGPPPLGRFGVESGRLRVIARVLGELGAGGAECMLVQWIVRLKAVCEALREHSFPRRQRSAGHGR